MPSVILPPDTTKAVLRVDVERLWRDIHHTAEWGMVPESYGMARLALSNDDKAVRDWFVAKAENLGCEVNVDAIGNIFAVLPGINKDIAPIGMGSHLDTQFNGQSRLSSYSRFFFLFVIPRAYPLS
jgi:N-carbamoyl-L-amino-acid hydrolase